MTSTLVPITEIVTEIVVLTSHQEADLDVLIRSLHEQLSTTMTSDWFVTIADESSGDSTLEVAERLARELSRTGVVALSGVLTRKALWAQWAGSTADTVAFVRIDKATDVADLIAPLARRTTRPAISAISSPSAAPVPGTRPKLGASTMPDGSALVTAADESDTVGKLVDLAGLRLSRRRAMFAVGGVGLTALLAACGSSARSSATATSSTSEVAATNPATTAATTAVAPATTVAQTSAPVATEAAATTAATAAGETVSLTPDMTEGPYYLDLNLVRSNIVEDREGSALGLTLNVVDASGASVEGAAVDIWHCDANGLYSGFVSQSTSANGGSSSDDGTFLRGTQLTDAAGSVTFATVYPGWYQGRTVHIHVKVNVAGKAIHTGQLFFDDAMTDQIYASDTPYSARSARTTRNDSDGIYQGGGSATVLAITGSRASYVGSLTMAVQA